MRPYSSGSPPRMREVCNNIIHVPHVIRITPAYAGSITSLRYFCYFYWDHPRVCGKYSFADGLQWIGPGSPPRMREVCSLDMLYISSTGITPAYAGSIIYPKRGTFQRRDHPRVCGKYSRNKGR